MTLTRISSQEPIRSQTLLKELWNCSAIFSPGKRIGSRECRNCGSKGHYRSQCPITEAQHIQTVAGKNDAVIAEGYDGNYALSYFQDTSDVSCRKSHRSHEETSFFRILLDSESTINTFKDRELLTNMITVDDPLVVLTNGGATRYSKKGVFGSLQGFMRQDWRILCP